VEAFQAMAAGAIGEQTRDRGAASNP
jgi:hypothetical protein